MHALRAFYCPELKETDGQAVSDDSLFLYRIGNFVSIR